MIPERNKLLAIANLASGKKPKEVAALCDISYAQALAVNKELQKAKEQDAVLELVNLNQAAFEELIDSVKTTTMSSAEIIQAEEALQGELQSLSDGVKGAKQLDTELQAAALQLARKINSLAIMSTNSDSVLLLADALAKLQLAFFAKGTNVQVNNYSQGSGFERFLGD